MYCQINSIRSSAKHEQSRGIIHNYAVVRLFSETLRILQHA